jgi:hypothetical protein
MRTSYQGALPWAFVDHDDLQSRGNLPFLGFLAGTVLSAGIWGVLATALWIVSKWPV